MSLASLCGPRSQDRPCAWPRVPALATPLPAIWPGTQIKPPFRAPRRRWQWGLGQSPWVLRAARQNCLVGRAQREQGSPPWGHHSLQGLSGCTEPAIPCGGAFGLSEPPAQEGGGGAGSRAEGPRSLRAELGFGGPQLSLNLTLLNQSCQLLPEALRVNTRPVRRWVTCLRLPSESLILCLSVCLSICLSCPLSLFWLLEPQVFIMLLPLPDMPSPEHLTWLPHAHPLPRPPSLPIQCPPPHIRFTPLSEPPSARGRVCASFTSRRVHRTRAVNNCSVSILVP